MNRRPTPARIAGAIAIIAFVVVALLFGFTAVSTEQDAASNVGFDPVTYVDGIWDDITSAIAEGAVPLADVLNRITPDADGKAATEDLTPIAKELGLITTGEAHVYRVNATGIVTDVDTASSRGSIGDFKDQTEYGKVASEINKRVVAGLEAAGVAGEAAKTLEGKPVKVTGAFTMRTFNQPRIDVSSVMLVPIEVAAQ